MDYSVRHATITKIRRLNSNTSVALFSVLLPSGVEIHHCFLKKTEDGRRWTVQPPRVPMLDENGELVFDGANRLVYGSALSFRNSAIREHFVATCLQAVQRQHPDIAVMRPERRTSHRK